MTAKIERPTPAAAIRDLHDRVRKLEAVEAVQFALDLLRYVFDNEGDWFFGAVNDASGSPNGYGWQFDSGSSSAPFAVTGDGGFYVDATGGITFANLPPVPGAAGTLWNDSGTVKIA